MGSTNGLTKAKQYKFVDVKTGITIAYNPIDDASWIQEKHTKTERVVIIRSSAILIDLVDVSNSYTLKLSRCGIKASRI